ncbi:hypothetical protein I552_4605 [Mycobacterium xenopi 3993]|nr:hypothetical protein I552_4605 [Mycobacterium xenopi 3993]
MGPMRRAPWISDSLAVKVIAGNPHNPASGPSSSSGRLTTSNSPLSFLITRATECLCGFTARILLQNRQCDH